MPAGYEQSCSLLMQAYLAHIHRKSVSELQSLFLRAVAIHSAFYANSSKDWH